jgi:hypothetical protein
MFREIKREHTVGQMWTRTWESGGRVAKQDLIPWK